MNSPFIIMDFDLTLLDTSFLNYYRSNEKGMEFIRNNAGRIKTGEYSPILKTICEEFSKLNRIVIVSDAPQDQTSLLMKKHGFPEMPVYGSSNKPTTASLSDILMRYNLKKEEILVVGDSPKDIVMAHSFNVASVGVTWSENNNTQHKKVLEEMLKRSQPNNILDNPIHLGEEIVAFYEGKFAYSPFQFPKEYSFFRFKPGQDLSINMISLGEYKPKNYTEHEKKIFDFKEAKEFYFSDIEKGTRSMYFWNGCIKGNRTYLSVINGFFQNAKLRLESLNLTGKTDVIAAPNSLPEYCYRSDINRVFADALGESYGAKHPRIAARIKPKQESHRGAGRNINHHLDTIGFYNNPSTIMADNIIIFDDVITTGSQLNSIALGLREMNFTGNLYALTLGNVKLE